MPEVLPTSTVNRWYTLRRPGSNEQWLFFAERYFDSKAEAFAYWEQRSDEVGFSRAPHPVRSHENREVWAVCIDPQ